MPLVSIAIRAFRRRWLPQAIASVLAQTHANLELIVYDDAGDLEDLAVAAADSRVRYVRASARHGASGRFIAAVRHCRGDIIGVLDDDDYYAPAFVAGLLAALYAEPRVGIAFCRTTFDVDGRLTRPIDTRPAGVMRDAARRMLGERWTVSPSHMLIRREALDAAWRHQMMPDGVSPDVFVNMGVAQAGWWHALIDAPLVCYRWHDAQHSRDSATRDLPIVTLRALRIDEPDLRALRDQAVARAYLARAVAKLCEGDRRSCLEDVRDAGRQAPSAWMWERRALTLAAHGGAAGTLVAGWCAAAFPRGQHRSRPPNRVGTAAAD